jgi:hypothetical protein
MSAVPTTACTREEAQQLTQKLLQSMVDSWHLLREAYVRRAWEALGYASWEEYCADALSTNAFRLSPEWRQQVVAQLSSGEQPMSNRAIGAALGVHHTTVAAARRAGGGNPPPADCDDASRSVTGGNPPVNEVIDAEIVEDAAAQPQQPQKRLGADGKSYPAPARTVPAPKPRRRPLMDDVKQATDNLHKAVQRLANLTGDDRLPQYREPVARVVRVELHHWRKCLTVISEAVLTDGEADLAMPHLPERDEQRTHVQVIEAALADIRRGTKALKGVTELDDSVTPEQALRLVVDLGSEISSLEDSEAFLNDRALNDRADPLVDEDAEATEDTIV